MRVAHWGLGVASGWVAGCLLGGCRHPEVPQGRRIAAAKLPALPSDAAAITG